MTSREEKYYTPNYIVQEYNSAKNTKSQGRLVESHIL